MSKEKNLELDRLVFFSDAVVAIAITLLALDLRFEPGGADISFNDIAGLWPRFAAFTLSFVLIAVFWKIHHEFFFFIRKIDSTLLWYNIFWLFFIVILPFSTTLVSGHFNQTVSIFVYSVNTLFITLFQNQIWDYVAVRPDYLNEKATPELVRRYRVACNVAMVNAIMAAILSFFSPVAAFLILFTRLLMMSAARTLIRPVRGEQHPAGAGTDRTGKYGFLLALMLLIAVLPVVSSLIDASYSNVGFDGWIFAKWFIFWACGVRLLLAGLRQASDPAFTARNIFQLPDSSSFPIVRELGFANISFGLIGVISLWEPDWRIVAACGCGLFYGLAGIAHVIKRPSSRNEKVALVTDLIIFAALAVYVIARL